MLQISKHLSRENARTLGFPRYFTGRPCANGHVCDRRVRDGVCVECRKNARKRERRAKAAKEGRPATSVCVVCGGRKRSQGTNFCQACFRWWRGRCVETERALRDQEKRDADLKVLARELAGTKICKRCGAEKAETDFRRHSGCHGGRLSVCRACDGGERNRKKRARHKVRLESDPEYKAAEYAKKRQRDKRRMARLKTEDPDAYRAQMRKRRGKRDPQKEAERRRRRYEANPGLKRAERKRYEAAQLRATPVWADHDKIKQIYKTASVFDYEVDHIVPLRSPIVCGLHVEHNLQLLDGRENARKGNRYWPDMP